MRARTVVTRSGKRFRGKFPSAKLGRMVHWESLHERDAILHLEYHPFVVSYQEQPSVEIYYNHFGAPHKYYPDFSALLSHGEEVLFEVKPEHFLKKREIREKFEAVTRRFDELGRRFRILSERDIRREPLFTNLKAIHSSAKNCSKLEVEQSLLNSLEACTSWRLDELAMRLGGVQSVLRLMRANLLCSDLEAPLTDNSTVWLATAGGARGSFRL